MAHHETRHEDTGAADGDEGAAAERDQLVEPGGSERRTDAGLRNGNSPTIEFYLENRVPPELGPEPSDLAASKGLDERADCVPKEAEHDVLGQVELLDRKMRFEHGLARRIELEDRSVAWVRHVISECLAQRSRMSRGSRRQ